MAFLKGKMPWLLGLGATIALLGATATGVTLLRQNNAANTQKTWAKYTVPVESTQLTLKITASGSIVPERTVNLSPKNAGRLEEVLVKQGDRVQGGQLIARMENRDIQAQLIQAQARVMETQARLRELQAGDQPSDQARVVQDVDQAQSQAQAQRAQVAQAEAQLIQDRAGIAEYDSQVVEAQAQYDLTRQQLTRNTQLAADGAISRDRLDELATNLRRAKASLERTQAAQVRASLGLHRSEANLAQAQATYQDSLSKIDSVKIRLGQSRASKRPEQIAQGEAQVLAALGQQRVLEVQLQDTLIRAPFAGIITQRYADPGAFVTPTTSASANASATSTSVVAIAQGLEVLANVPEVDIGKIHLGQIVEVKSDTYAEQAFVGKVRLIAPEAVKEQNVTSFQIRVSLMSGLQQLKSGMNVDLTFMGETLNNTLVVPTVAILVRKGETGVLRLDERGNPKFYPVTTGATIGTQTQVIEGVKVGDRVFTDLPKDPQFKEFNQPS
jgi:HlyD family secretion protein